MKSVVCYKTSQNSPEICLFSDPRLTLLAWSRDTILANLRPSSMRVCCMSWRLQVMRPVVSVGGWGDEDGCNWGLISIKTHTIRQTCLSITCYGFFQQCFTLTRVWMETNLENHHDLYVKVTHVTCEVALRGICTECGTMMVLGLHV